MRRRSSAACRTVRRNPLPAEASADVLLSCVTPIGVDASATWGPGRGPSQTALPGMPCCRRHRHVASGAVDHPPCPGTTRRNRLAQRAPRRSGAPRTAPRDRRRPAHPRQRGHHPGPRARRARGRGGRPARPGHARGRTKFQVVALLVREERARVKADADRHRGQRTGSSSGSTASPRSSPRPPPATPRCSRCSPRTPSSPTPPRAQARDAARPPASSPSRGARARRRADAAARRHRAASCRSRSSRASSPTRSWPPTSPPPRARARRPPAGRLGAARPAVPRRSSTAAAPPACRCPSRRRRRTAPGACELMHHQAQVVAAAAAGHRTFLLADEPGLGKTAQALLAAEAADAFPLLVVVPNVVKTNWAREAELWTPRRPATVIHGDGDDDRRLRRHRRRQLRGPRPPRRLARRPRLPRHGRRRGALHQEQVAPSAPSTCCSSPSGSGRARANPLLMALTGTPLINDIEDFRAIWQFLGWIDDKKPLARLMAALEETGLTPVDPGFYAAARASVIDLGIVRRRKVDVAADIPARRVADLPVELDDDAGRSIREAERELARRLVARYDTRARPPAGPAPYGRRHRPRAGPPRRHVGARGHRPRPSPARTSSR